MEWTLRTDEERNSGYGNEEKGKEIAPRFIIFFLSNLEVVSDMYTAFSFQLDLPIRFN